MHTPSDHSCTRQQPDSTRTYASTYTAHARHTCMHAQAHKHIHTYECVIRTHTHKHSRTHVIRTHTYAHTHIPRTRGINIFAHTSTYHSLTHSLTHSRKHTHMLTHIPRTRGTNTCTHIHIHTRIMYRQWLGLLVMALPAVSIN